MELTIYQTNDIHSDFERLAGAAAYIKSTRKPEDLYFDCGDLCDLKDLTVQGTAGKGAVSKKKLLELSPSKLNPTRFPVRGSALKEAVLHSLDAEFVSQSGQGAGVRGKILGTLGFSHNVKIQQNPFAVWVDNKPLEDERIYDCVADDALQRGTGYLELAVPDEQAEFYRGFIRDLLERTLQNRKLWETAGRKRVYEA